MAVRGAPNRAELDYFPKMVNFYEDDKIFDLMDEYGPLGVTIYDCILTIVYSNGYFVNLSKDKLSRMVIRKIGNKWIKGQKVVVQVIDYCADLGLLSKDLMLRDIITSEGIQKRYYKIAVKLMKRQLYNSEYWLLSKNGEPFLNSSKNLLSSEEIRINSEENQFNSELIHMKEKETKVKEKKNTSDKDSGECGRLKSVLDDFIAFRKSAKKPMTDHAIELLKNQLNKLAPGNTDRQIAILEQSIMNGWTGIYDLNEGKKDQKKQTPAKQNQFHNFEQRDTDYDALITRQFNGREGE